MFLATDYKDCYDYYFDTVAEPGCDTYQRFKKDLIKLEYSKKGIAKVSISDQSASVISPNKLAQNRYPNWHVLTDLGLQHTSSDDRIYGNEFSGYGYLVFCGTVYPFVRYESCKDKAKHYIYSMESLLTFAKEQRNLKDLDKLFGVTSKYSWNNSKSAMEKYLVPQFETWAEELHIAFDSPIIVVENRTHTFHFERPAKTLNPTPVLEDIGFASIMHPYEIYTRIEGYLTNEMARQVDLEPKGIDDKMRANYKGFDDWSFRTMPGDKKPKRRKHRKLQQQQ